MSTVAPGCRPRLSRSCLGTRMRPTASMVVSIGITVPATSQFLCDVRSRLRSRGTRMTCHIWAAPSVRGMSAERQPRSPTAKENPMSAELKTVIYPVHDLEKAKALFSGLLGGVQPVMDQPYYVQFDIDGTEVGLDPHGHNKGMTGPVGYWHVPDIKQAVADAIEAGGSEGQAVTDFGGRLVGTVKDA